MKDVTNKNKDVKGKPCPPVKTNPHPPNKIPKTRTPKHSPTKLRVLSSEEEMYK